MGSEIEVTMQLYAAHCAASLLGVTSESLPPVFGKCKSKKKSSPPSAATQQQLYRVSTATGKKNGTHPHSAVLVVRTSEQRRSETPLEIATSNI